MNGFTALAVAIALVALCWMRVQGDRTEAQVQIAKLEHGCK